MKIKWKKGLIKWAKRILKNQVIDRINYEPLQAHLLNLYNQLVAIINILMDSDPDNRQQFKDFWNREQTKIFDMLVEQLAELVRKLFKDKEKGLMYSEMILDMRDDFHEEDIEEIT